MHRFEGLLSQELSSPVHLTAIAFNLFVETHAFPCLTGLVRGPISSLGGMLSEFPDLPHGLERSRLNSPWHHSVRSLPRICPDSIAAPLYYRMLTPGSLRSVTTQNTAGRGSRDTEVSKKNHTSSGIPQFAVTLGVDSSACSCNPPSSHVRFPLSSSYDSRR